MGKILQGYPSFTRLWQIQGSRVARGESVLWDPVAVEMIIASHCLISCDAIAVLSDFSWNTSWQIEPKAKISFLTNSSKGLHFIVADKWFTVLCRPPYRHMHKCSAKCKSNWQYFRGMCWLTHWAYLSHHWLRWHLANILTWTYKSIYSKQHWLV